MEELDSKHSDKGHETSPSQELKENLEVHGSNDFSNWKRKAVLFLASQTFSLFGSSIVQYAILWYITLTTKSGPMMTLSAISGFLPQVLISFFAGVWADRYNRKMLIIFGDILTAFSTAILVVFFLSGYKELWLLFVVSGIRSIGAGIQSPAIGALIPQIVPAESLMKFNGINSSIQSLIMLISPAVSGALLTVATLESTFFIDIITAAIAVAIMLTLRIPLHEKAAQQQTTGYLADVSEGIRYIANHSFIKTLIAFYSVFFFFVTPAAFLTPLMIARSFGEEVWRLTLNEMLFFAGSVVGGLIIASWGGFKNRTHTLALSCIMFGVLTAALGLSTIFLVYLVIMFITGFFMPLFNSASTVMLQEKVEQSMHGRIFGVIGIVSSVSMPLGMVIFGPLAEVVAVELLLIITGIIMTALGGSIFFNKTLLQAG